MHNWAAPQSAELNKLVADEQQITEKQMQIKNIDYLCTFIHDNIMGSYA